MEEYAYHSTFLRHLSSIASEGLVPGTGSQFSGGYAGHSQGKIFFSDWDGVPYWFSKMENIAEAESDFKEEEDVVDWTPVVLRVDLDCCEFYDDKPGQKDSYADAFFTKDEVDPNDIDVWDGKKWVWIGEVNEDKMSNQALKSATYDSDNGEGWWWVDFTLFEPQKE
tara:strand:- start:1072 stop:1572 length:501 start_codon:yes stop_codon:yes gene_type:complete